MNTHVDLSAHMEAVAILLLGEPSDKSKTVLRWGSRGSFSVSISKGTFYDHETGTGGGVLDLIERETGKSGADRMIWLADNKFIDPLPTGDGRKPKIVKTYDYHDEDGVLLFQVCRQEPKNFLQRKPDPARPGEWIWKVQGVRQVPYRLPELVSEIELGNRVFIVEGEKDVDRLRGLGVPATTNAGGVGKWGPELTEFFHGADVVIIQDNDPQTKHPKTGEPQFHPDGRPKLPGQDHAVAVAAALSGVAAKVSVLDLAKVWPDMPLKGDVSDWLDNGGTADALYNLAGSLTVWSKRPEPVSDDGGQREFAPLEGEAIEPEAVSDASPTPLTRPSAPSAPYPLDALGDVLGAAAKAIAAKVQCPEAMSAQSVLGVASLAAQGLVDVLLPFGQTRPLSLFPLTIAASGDRKTSADNEAMIPVRMREKKLGDAYKILNEIFDIDLAAWKAQRGELERGKMEREARAAALQKLGPEPAAPVRPYLTINEGTAEGLAKLMPQLPGALGIFSAEGAQFLNGHGFTHEAKLRTAAAFATLWDGKELRGVRAGDGMRGITGRRLACHAMIQPDAARGVLSDPVLRDQGFLSRFLPAAAESLAGGRMWKEPAEGIEPALRRYTATMLTIFEIPQPAANAQGNELTPRSLALSPSARELWIEFYNEVERDMGKGRRFAEMQDVASKGAEQAARIAGVLAMVDDPYAADVGADAMGRACILMHWYLSEALRLAEAYCVPQEVADAEAVLEWARARGLRKVDAATIQKSGPGPVRRKDRFDPAIEALLASGWFMPDDKAAGKARRWIVTQEKAK